MEKRTRTANLTVGKMIGSMAGVAAAVGVFRTLSSAVDSAVSRYDTLNNFPRVLEQIGFSSGESEQAINDLSDGIQGLPTTLDEVAGTAQRLAVMTGDLDGAVDTTLALNNAFLASGSDSAAAARGLQQYTEMLGRGEVDLTAWRTLMETMGPALNDVAKSFGFAGASAQNDLYDALKSGDITFDEFNARLIELSNETGGFADRAKTASGGIRTAFTNMNTAVARGITNIIENIDGFLANTPFKSIQNIIETMGATFFSVLDGMAKAITPVGNMMLWLFNILKPFAPLITAILVAVGGFLGSVAIINSVTKAVALLQGAVTILGKVIMANPIGLFIGVLAGLAYMFMHLYKTSETFRNAVNNAFAQIQAIVMPIVQTVSAFVMQIWGSLVAWWNENNAQIMDTVQNVWSTIMNVVTLVVGEVVAFVMQIWGMLTVFWQEHGTMILEAARNVWMVIQTVITTVVTVIWTIIQTMATIITNIMVFLWPFVRELILSTWEAIKGAIQGAINVITGIIQFFSAMFTGNWSAMWDAVKQIVSGAVQFVWNYFQIVFVGKILGAGKAFAKSLSTRIKDMWETIRLVFMYAVDFVKSFVSRGFTAVRTTITTIMSTVRNVISTVWNFIKSIISTVVNGIKNTISSVFNGIKNVITSVVNGIRNTISNVWNGILNTIRNITNRIKSTISNIFNSLKGIVSGAFGKVTGAVRTGMSGAYKAVTGKVKDFFNAGKNIVGSIADGIKENVKKVTGAISGVADKIREFLPFSPAKRGALRDIMKVRISESLAESIRNGEKYAVRAMEGVSDSVYNQIPDVDIARKVNSLHNRSNGQMRYDYHNEMTVQRQPMLLNLVLGEQQFEVFVDDVTNVQNRKIRLEDSFR